MRDFFTMARYEHLPIYRQTLDVAVHFEKVVSGFNRYHKYTLGTEFRNKSGEEVNLVVKAIAAHDKHPHLRMATEIRVNAVNKHRQYTRP